MTEVPFVLGLNSNSVVDPKSKKVLDTAEPELSCVDKIITFFESFTRECKASPRNP